MSGGTKGSRPISLALRLVGEFGVIVLGVLVALTLEGWYGDRLDAERETDLLQSLAADLNLSRDSLVSENTKHSNRVATLEWFLQFPVDDEAGFPEDSIGSIAFAANFTEAYYPTLRTYESLIATGALDLISNAEIRLALAEVKFRAQFYTDYRNQATQQWNDTYSVTWLTHMGVHRLPGGEFSPETMPNPTTVAAVEDALRDDFFRAVIDRRRIFLWYVADYGRRMAGTMQAALDLIDDELAARDAGGR
jgi:hypothetical protein